MPSLLRLVATTTILVVVGTHALVPSPTRHLARRKFTFPAAEDKPREPPKQQQVPEQPDYDVEPFFADLQSPVTLTVIGFGLIAFNFFVLANL
ncbi:hypothetical protein CTAYLR_007825 [Chrysophaeum taylorii]|uniref:Uncharacterized protein n=1 Tax=Chrysophaeum taylorii TaxID=2483200 RepID=A0AAD7UA47_9STRA|nr:hypothetical protein CTAYLR_007825 [Chrysophaeum taylorii]